MLVFQRGDDGIGYVKPVDAKRMANYLDEFKPGEVWSNEGEAGLVAKDNGTGRPLEEA